MDKLSMGVDLGSTYSCFTVYDPAEDNAYTKTDKEGTGGSVPSLVCIDDCGDFLYGKDAKEQQFMPDVRLFRTFKMLLPEAHEEILKKWNYDSVYTPQIITQNFLDYYLKSIAKRELGTEAFIEQLVICAPEVWSNSDDMRDGRPLLKDICSSLRYVKNVRVVSEPAAAAAYYAYNYIKESGQPYDGYILIIDYGGGTLDITLTDVKSTLQADGTTTTEVQIMASVGAGENQKNGKVGDAGIAYMQELCAEALRSAGKLPENQQPDEEKTKKLFGQMETKLLQEKTISTIDTNLALDPDAFAHSTQAIFKVSYDGAVIEVTGELLNKAYERVIQPVLDKQLDAMIEIIERWKGFGKHKQRGLENYTKWKTDNFKIALVGGFGSFGLVEKQVEDKFGFTGADHRKYEVSAEKKECAVALGAGLIAGGVIQIIYTADRSLGIQSISDGKIVYDWAFQCHEELTPGEVYFIRHEDGTPITYYNPDGKIESFAFARQDGKPSMLPLKKELQEKLAHLPSDESQYGFSLDHSGVYYFHVLARNSEGEFERFGEPIRLDQANRFCSGLHQLG